MFKLHYNMCVRIGTGEAQVDPWASTEATLGSIQGSADLSGYLAQGSRAHITRKVRNFKQNPENLWFEEFFMFLKELIP